MTRDWHLPTEAHVPGLTPRPRASPAFDAAAAAPAVTNPARWRENAAHLYGLRLYDAGFFWEAHEVLEPVWAGAAPNSRARALVQGLIQLANACLKLRMERPRAAERLAHIAADHLAGAGSGEVMGIDAAALAAACLDFAVILGSAYSVRAAIEAGA